MTVQACFGQLEVIMTFLSCPAVFMLIIELSLYPGPSEVNFTKVMATRKIRAKDA